MTAPDPRLGEIEGRQHSQYLHENTRAQMGADVAYLLAELRKAQDALGMVEGLHFAAGDPDHSYADICFECCDTYPCSTIDAIRAAVAAATGGGE